MKILLAKYTEWDVGPGLGHPFEESPSDSCRFLKHYSWKMGVLEQYFLSNHMSWTPLKWKNIILLIWIRLIKTYYTTEIKIYLWLKSLILKKNCLQYIFFLSILQIGATHSRLYIKTNLHPCITIVKANISKRKL